MQTLKFILLMIVASTGINAFAANTNAAQLDFSMPPAESALTPDQTPPLMMAKTNAAPTTTVTTTQTTTTTTKTVNAPGTPTPQQP